MNTLFIKKVITAVCLSVLCMCGAYAYTTPESQMEKLGRGVVALKNGQGSGNFVSWRLLGTDNSAVTFNLLRDGEIIKQGISDATCYTDNVEGVHQYQVQTVLNGNVIETSETVSSVDDYYLKLKLDRPSAGSDYTYTPNDCSVGDVDGDGEYELVVKWDPSNSQDNSVKAKTGPTYIDCYKLDGTRLWRINLRHNIRSGAHYVPFLVYDFDGDGKAEMICKTAPGSRDAAGDYVSAAADDSTIVAVDNTQECWNSNGLIMTGEEFLTVFNGETGKAIHTVWYNPNRAGGVGEAGTYPAKSYWGDNYANRSERYLACVAYLGGQDKNPSAVMCRGYYTRAYLWAVDFDGSKLTTRWLHGSVSTTSVELTDASGNKTTTTYSSNTAGTTYSKTLYGNGNHNLSVADVDGDGCDEIIYGSGACDHDGSLLYAVGFGHGDAMHVSDLLPDRPGLEVFDVHEEKHPAYGWDIHDAATGEVILSETGSGDNGRGMAADVYDGNRGFEFWSAKDKSVRSALTGDTLSTKQQSTNFRLYWDGDAYDELFDGRYDNTSLLCNPKITKYNGSSSPIELKINSTALANLGNSMSCNTTKATPNLSCDLFGDWREEVILWDASDSCTLNIFTTSIPTAYRVPTLMHDHTYRMGVAWQNAAYNQPPHLGYYLPDYLGVTVGVNNAVVSGEGWIKLNGCSSVSIYAPVSTQATVVMTDISGRLCFRKSLNVSGTQTVSLPALAKGTYIINVKSGSDTLSRKIIRR